MAGEVVVSSHPPTKEVRVGGPVTPQTHHHPAVTPIIDMATKVGIVCHHFLVLGRTSCLHGLERKTTQTTQTTQTTRHNEALTSPAKASPKITTTTTTTTFSLTQCITILHTKTIKYIKKCFMSIPKKSQSLLLLLSSVQNKKLIGDLTRKKFGMSE